MEGQNHPKTLATLVAMLVGALDDLGLAAEGFGGSMVWAANRGANPPDRALRPAPLRQVVQCRRDDLGHWGWWWVWTTPGEMPTYEWFAPALDIESAAGKIAHVLALHAEAAS